MPVARAPSWQLKQPSTMPSWVKLAGFHATVAWHVSQAAVVATCNVCLPDADLPSWHDAHVPMTCEWSKRVIGAQFATEWQDSQVLVVCRCAADLPVAWTPSWQDVQLPVMPEWSYRAGLQAVLLWQLEQSWLVET